MDSLTRIFHQTLGKLEPSVSPNIPKGSLGNGSEHSLRESIEISKKQTVQSCKRAGEKYGLITSFQNSRIKEALKLRNRRMRKQTDRFLIEGFRELKRALDAKKEIETLLYCPELFLGSNETFLLNQCKTSLRCTKEIFYKISYRDRPDGLLAIAPQFHRSLADLELKKTPFLVVAESIEKPGNLGTILRSSDAAGADAVIVCDPKVDIFNPNVVRSSVGTLFTVSVIEAKKEAVLQFLKDHQIVTIATTPGAKCNYFEVDFNVPLAIVVGTEQYGLSETWLKNGQMQVGIPMLGVADSLNVASATTLILYEVIRQRSHLLR